jgi:hypothetical protein
VLLFATETTNPVLDIDLPTAVDHVDGSTVLEKEYCYIICALLSCRAAQLAFQTFMHGRCSAAVVPMFLLLLLP